MRFLFINQYYAPDYAATAQQLTALCESLASEGHDVHVLASRSLYDGRDIALKTDEIINGVQVHRVGSTVTKRDRLRQRLMGYLLFYFCAFIAIHRLPRPDVAVTLTTPPLISLLGIWLRIVRRARFVYWVMDIYPDIAVRAGVLSKYSPLTVIWSCIAWLCYAMANKVVVLGEGMKSTIQRKGINEKKIEIIQCWSSKDQVFPVEAPENSFRKQHITGEEFTVMYSGNMGTCHPFESIVEDIHRLNGHNNLRFLFVGGGKKLPYLKKELAGEKSVSFYPYQDHTDLAHSLSAPDAHLVCLDSTFDGLLVPSKIYGIMAAARPAILVGSGENDVARLIQQSSCGVVIPQDDPEALYQALKYFESHPEEAREMGKRGRAYFERYCEQGIAVRRFQNVLEAAGKERCLRGYRPIAHSAMRISRTQIPRLTSANSAMPHDH